MVREIEYRAWIPSWGEMVFSSDSEDVNGVFWQLTNKGFVLSIDTCDEYGGGYKDFEDVILMQYTGIKDKNGVKIYEGDVVNIRNIDGVFKIVFDEWLCGFYAVNYDYNDMRKNPKKSFNLMRAFEFFEVVGSIHEDKK